MAELAVIVPSRGRPRQLAKMVAAVHATATGDVDVRVGVDDDDPTADEYFRVLGSATVCRGPRDTLSGWTNFMAGRALDGPDAPHYLASLGDDHRPRTKGWHRRLIGAIGAMGGSGIAYGNDLLQGANLPTAWVVSADIVRTLGWMMLPTCQHMYVDTAVLEVGRALGRIAYCPDVVIEHVHPLAGKADWDESYRQSNRAERYAADRAAFEAWKRDGLAGDVQKLLALHHPALSAAE